MESGWDGCDIGGDTQIPPEWAEEICGAIGEAAHSPIQAEETGMDAGCAPGWDGRSGWDSESSWSGPVSGENPAPAGSGQNLSEEDAAALLVELMSTSAVNVEDGRLTIEPDPAEVEQWSDQKGRDARDIIGQVVAQPENVSLILDALELERPRLDGLMAEYDEVLAQHGNDQDDPEVAELAEQIQDLHTKIQDLTEQYMTLAGLHVPDSRSREPQM